MNTLSEFARRIPLTLALLGMVVATFVAYVVSEKQIDVANEQRQTSFFLMSELRHSSDDLTRMVRTYVATGNPLFKRHFQEILDIRDGRMPRPADYQYVYWDLVGPGDERPQPSVGAVPLLVLMRQAGFTDAEFAKLAEAKNSSDDLAKIEFAAMALLEKNDPSTPESRQRALGMLHDARYHEAKARIMGPIAESYAMVDQRTLAAVAAAEERAVWVRSIFVVLATLLAWQLYGARRREAQILGGSIEKVHDEIASLDGSSRSETESRGRGSNILGEVLRTKARLAELDTARKGAEDALRASHEQLKEAQRIASTGSWVLDLRSNRLEWSDEIYRIFEIDPSRFGASYDAFLNAIHPEDRDKVNSAYVESLTNRTPYEITHRLLFADGRIKYVQERSETTYAVGDGPPILSRGTVQDITERKRQEEALHLYAKMFEHSAEAIMITDAGNCIVAVNAAFTRQTGYTLEEVRGKNPRILASQRTSRDTYQVMWASIRESGYWQGELWDRAKDGHVYPKWISISVIRNPAGELTHYVASFIDMSERKAVEEHINRLAHHDPLTGLFNRFSLHERLEQALLTAQRDGRQVVVMFIDMDRFKSINDTLGHQAGDALLIEVARRLQDTVRESDIVARLGGDEFVVVLTGVESGMLAGASLAGKILHQLGLPYAYREKLLHSTPSIGLSIYPPDGDGIETLMKHADLAMYSAKEQGKNTFQFFSPEMNKDASERMLIEQDLRVALEREEFVLHYQPQICAADGSIFGLEALIRWCHPQHGMVPPAKFIPVAEEIGLIENIGAWVLNEACRQFAAWKTGGIRVDRIAVNLSAHQLRSSGLVDLVRTAMRLHGLGTGELELEVTESVAMNDPLQAIAQLSTLRQLGVELAIDDFGTGYSSLAYLKLLPIQTLKLDRSFVKDIEGDENDATISIATISLAHSLGLKVVAEGVETEGQRDFLASHRCDILQGYLISKPLPAGEADAFLRGRG